MVAKLFAERVRFGDSIDVRYVHEQSNGFWVGKPVVIERLDDGLYMEPTLNLKTDEAQQLMDELWRCGLRPTEGTGSAGSLAATQAHLDNMTAIAFAALNKSGVKVK